MILGDCSLGCISEFFDSTDCCSLTFLSVYLMPFVPFLSVLLNKICACGYVLCGIVSDHFLNKRNKKRNGLVYVLSPIVKGLRYVGLGFSAVFSKIGRFLSCIFGLDVGIDSVLALVFMISGVVFLHINGLTEVLVFYELMLPLIGVLTLGLGTKLFSLRSIQIVLCSYMFAGMVISVMLVNDIVFNDVEPIKIGFDWISLGGLNVSWSINYDVLTAVMAMLVMTVSFLVHLYSIGYMAGDAGEKRFFIYLSLFTFCMMMLINADNFLQLFFGWEGVGLSSYLLVGYWFTKDSANIAAMKAFITNRVGDLGLLIALFLIYWNFGSLNFADVFPVVYSKAGGGDVLLGLTVVDWICLLLFVGCMGKSAQIGLHVWLPDAMEGPTPVSALIHAATMVTAGVFLLARCSIMFEYSCFAREFIVVVGGITCFFAATVAVVQRDIKKVIAYSTCSQLGYMMMACGVSAYSAGVFHLLTHGFFKALLFLGAGSVIHAVVHEQDMYKMGQLSGKIKFTYLMMWLGSLALAGVFPFAGYYSKDAILEAMYVSGNGFGYFMGMASAFLTAFYSWKLIIIVFHGKKGYSKSVEKKIHESPPVMLLPLLVLSVGAIFGDIGGQIMAY